MWVYQKMLQYPAGTVSTCNPKLAKDIITQYGGPDGELAASLRYLTQRYTMPIPEAKAALTDIGTEELAHMEIVATLVYQLVRDASVEQIIAAGMDGYYADHDKALYFVNGDGVPWTAAYIQSKGDPITDIHENMAAEQKARSTYEYLIQISNAHGDQAVTDTLTFLWQREIVHFQRFGEILNLLHDYYSRDHYFEMRGWNPYKVPDVPDAGK
ncbi:MAG: manganese catalase family protein [Bacillota bacterium]|jgi:spore coat protein JC